MISLLHIFLQNTPIRYLLLEMIRTLHHTNLNYWELLVTLLREYRSNKHNLKVNCGFVHSEVIQKHVTWFDNEEDANPITLQILWPFWTPVALPEFLTPTMEHTSGHSCLPAVTARDAQFGWQQAKLACGYWMKMKWLSRMSFQSN